MNTNNKENEERTELVRDLGAQPIDAILNELGFSNDKVVAASAEQISHKMVSRARKGRRLKRNVQDKIHRAMNKLSERKYEISALFNYRGKL